MGNKKKQTESRKVLLESGVLLQSSSTLWQVFIAPDSHVEVSCKNRQTGTFQPEPELTQSINLTIERRSVRLAEIMECIGIALSSSSPRQALNNLWQEEISTHLIKVGLHLERQKFGKSKAETERWLSTLGFKEGTLGLDLSVSQNKALFALQKILHQTGYKGNSPGDKLDGSGVFKYSGELPQIEFTPAQYLEAYGVGKNTSNRGKKEFHRQEREEALEALHSLADLKFHLVYERVTFLPGKKEPKSDLIATTQPLIRIIWGVFLLSKKERQRLKDGEISPSELDKRATVGVFPTPIFLDQLDNYFLLKPCSLFEDIKKISGKRRHSKYIPAFIEWLIATAELQRRKNEGWTVQIGYKKLAEQLRMQSYIERRQWARIRKILVECYEMAKELGYLIDYKTIKGKTVDLMEEFHLNPDKYYNGKSDYR